MNFTDYLETVEPSDFYFVDGGRELLQGSSGDDCVLLTADFASQVNLQVGDILPVMMVSYAELHVLNVRVVGLVKGLPGLAGADAFIERRTISTIPIENLTGIFTNNGALIDVADGMDPSEVADYATRLLEGASLTSTPTLLQDRLDMLDKDPTYASLADFLRMEYALSIVIMTIGVGLLIFVSVHDRENELACIMARGSSGGQVRKILMG